MRQGTDFDTAEVLHSPFSFQTHKEAFGSTYLEAILFSDGHLEYAIPSHQEKLIAIMMEKEHLTREGVCDKCPKEYYYSFLDWLLMETGCVSVWTDFYIGEPNAAQKNTIRRLVKEGIFHCNKALCRDQLWKPYATE